jgi:hypothetical protein
MGVRVWLLDARTLAAITPALDPRAIALQTDKAVALADGRVFTADLAELGELVQWLGWQRAPLEVRHGLTPDEWSREAARAPFGNPHGRQIAAYVAATRARAFFVAQPLEVLVGGLALGLTIAALMPLQLPRRQLRANDPNVAEQSFQSFEKPVLQRPPSGELRVLLVSDPRSLDSLRSQLGDEVVAVSRDALALSSGWLVAVRPGSVFELMATQGWGHRNLRLASRDDLEGAGEELRLVAGEAHSVGDALELCRAALRSHRIAI